jgi:putative salt-induced outer membrane protein YdiY
MTHKLRITVARWGLLLALLLGLAGCANRPAKTAKADDWSPPVPAEGDGFDWIQLKTGEWLKGQLVSMQEEKVEFDSEKLDLLTFDWVDINVVRAPGLHSVRFEKQQPRRLPAKDTKAKDTKDKDTKDKVIEGSVIVTRNDVQVITPDGVKTYPRTELIAITKTGNRELDKWQAKLAAGVSLSRGNTETNNINIHATLDRRTAESRLSLDYLNNYEDAFGVASQNNLRITGTYDYFLSSRLYTRVPDLEYYRDPLQNIEKRITVGVGLGYDLFKTPKTEWNVTLSPSWQKNWYYSVGEGQDPSPQALAWVFSTKFDTDLTDKLEWIFEYRGQLTSKETGSNTHHAVSTLEFEIHKRLKLDLSLIWDRISSPKTTGEGVTPVPDDYQLITSLGIDF